MEIGTVNFFAVGKAKQCSHTLQSLKRPFWVLNGGGGLSASAVRNILQMERTVIHNDNALSRAHVQIRRLVSYQSDWSYQLSVSLTLQCINLI